MISDRDLVLAAKDTYVPGRKPFFQGAAGALRVFVDDIDGMPVISIEGTHDPIGWAIDFIAIPEEDRPKLDHPSLGLVHAGMHESALLILDAIKGVIAEGPYGLNGHSLGAGLALGIGGLMVVAGTPPVKIGAFAPPRFGGDAFVAILEKVPIAGFEYADDPIPHVPFRLPGFPYRQIALNKVGRGDFARAFINPFKYHHIDNYVAGIA